MSRQKRCRCRPHQKRWENRFSPSASVKTSCWYINFLHPGVRELMSKVSMSDRYGKFCHWFRMPLGKIELLVDLFIRWGYIPEQKRTMHKLEYRERAELLVMSSLYLLGRGAVFCSCRALCYISVLKIQKFFFAFLDAFYNDLKSEYIKLPGSFDELRQGTHPYESVGLPGACGLMDVVHVKWSNCPTGDYNQAKGKEGYPTLGFQCTTIFNWRILGVYGLQFGTVNDKHIVKTNLNVRAI
jgi:hypothetical protein